MVVLGVIQSAGVFFGQGVPQMKESFKIIAGDSDMGMHELRRLIDGQEVEFSSGITFGVAAELERLLDTSPNVRMVHLNSHGGRIGEARAMRELFRERDFNTFSATEYLSACTVAFLGRQRRFLDSDARLGFHAADFPGSSDHDLRAANQEFVEEAVAYGVDRRFATRAYFTQ